MSWAPPEAAEQTEWVPPEAVEDTWVPPEAIEPAGGAELANATAQQEIEQNFQPGRLATNATAAVGEVLSGFVPRSIEQAAGFVTPLVAAKDAVVKGVETVREIGRGTPLKEITSKIYPESQVLVEAQKTEPGSQKRFAAGFGLLAQVGMVFAGGKGILRQKLDPVIGERAPVDGTITPEAAAIAPELAVTAAEPAILAPERPADAGTPAEAVSAGTSPAGRGLNGSAAPDAIPPTQPRPLRAEADATVRPETLTNEQTPAPIQAAPENPLQAQRVETAAPEGEILSPGPGAASAAEPLASYEQRRFGKRFQESEDIAPEIREQTGNQYYEPVSNKVTLAEAENLIETNGTDASLRLVRDEAAPLQPRVRVTMGQALIKKLNQSHTEAKAAGDAPRASEFLNQAVDTAEYLSELGTTLGQGTQAFAVWSRLTPEGMLLEATRMAKKSGTDLTPEQTSKIADLTAQIEKAPEGFQRNEKTMELMNFMSEMKGVNPGDIPTALWYSNILSGYSTQMVNFLDTGLNVLSESAAMAASHPTAIPTIISGLYRGMIKGGFEAANALKTGKSVTGDKVMQQKVLERVTFGKEGGVPIDPSTASGRFLKRAFESKAAMPLNLWKYPLRLMVASDTVMFNSMKEARVRVLARGLAKKEGLSGDALFKRVDEVLNQGPGKFDAALKQAQDEGLTGLQQRRRVQEIIEQGRADDLVSAADEAAQIATYNHNPTGVLGLVAQNIANITQGFPVAKAVVPFTRIVANVTNRGLNYTPWAYKRLFFGEWGGKRFSTDPPTGEAYRTQLVKGTLGTTAMTAVAVLDANETIQITANGPQDHNERKQLQNAGWKPYSVKVGDTYLSYQYTPVNLGFAMVGHYRDAIRYNKLSEKDAQTRMAYAALKSSSTIFDMSFLSGVSDFLETVQGATSSTKGTGRLLARTSSSVVVPNLAKQIDKLFDPTVYQADDIQQALIRETPVARSMALKPMLNALGEPIRPSQNRFFTFDTKDPVWRLIVEKQAWVPVPSKTTKIGNRAITPDEYYRLVEQSGPMIRDHVEKNLDRYRGMTAEQVQDDIRDWSNTFRATVKAGFR